MNALESLVIASFVRGLSVRDVEAALAKAPGDQAAISRSTVSPIRGQIKDEYQTWARRRLDGVKLDYLFLDASFFRMHPGSPAEPVLAAWGITTDGKPVFIGLAPGTGESFDAWKDFLADLRDRGLASAAGHRQRRRGRADRRDRAGLPEGATSALCDPSVPEPAGQDPGRDAGRGRGRLLEDLRHQRARHRSRPAPGGDHRRPDQRDGRQVLRRLPLGDEVPDHRPRRPDRLPALPAEHHNRVRHSIFIERTFGETRRRVKVIGRLPGETAASPWSGRSWTGPRPAGADSP